MESTKEVLTAIKERAIAAANDSMSDKDRQIIQKEINEYIAQIDYNTGTTYNGKYLIDGSHRRPTDGTIQALTNQQLSELTTTVTMLVELQDRQGEYLEIKDTDRIDISYVKDAKTYTTSYLVGTTTLQDVIDRTNSLNGEVFNQTYTTTFIGLDAGGAEIFTSDNKNAITLRSVGVGVEHSVGGFTLSIQDSQGNIKKAANSKLDAFVETITPRDLARGNLLSTQTAEKANRKVEIDFNDLSSIALGLKSLDKESVLSVATKTDANAAIRVADTALQRVTDELTKAGAMMARLEYTAANLTTYEENLTAAESNNADADIAKEMLEYTKADINVQEADSMLQFLTRSSRENIEMYMRFIP